MSMADAGFPHPRYNQRGMKRLLIRWVILAVALVISAWLTGLVIKGFSLKVEGVADVGMIFVGVAVLALVNATLGKLLKLLTLPLNCLTLGIFSLLINAVLFWGVGSLGLGFNVENFISALLGSVLFSACAALLDVFVPDDDKDKD